MKASILLIGNNKNKQLFKEFLTSHSYNVDCAKDGLEGIKKYKSYDYDLILLDIDIPNLDGFSICKMIRNDSDVPIIFVTDENDESLEIKAFDLGGDDYIVRPCSFNILIRHIEAVLRRCTRKQKNLHLSFGKLQLDLKTYSVEIEEKNIDLTLKEFKILKSLIESYPQVVTREKLLDNIWGYDYFGDTRIVDAHIKNIRKKIVLPYIKTVKGVGYTLKEENHQ